MKKALITGVSGQDGAYLAKSLADKGYEVHGTSRDASVTSFHRLEALGVGDRVTVHSMALTDFYSVMKILDRVRPNEVYNLAGQSSVGLSFAQPFETITSNVTGVLNLLEGIRFIDTSIRFYNAGSSESFGNVGETRATIRTGFNPNSPYAVSKAAAFWEVANYRDAYDLFACSGVLFNHESPLRGSRFVTKKIIATACRIAQGSREELTLGNMNIFRDWGWAAEYVEAMWLMLQQDVPDDYVIATGKRYSLCQFVEAVFSCLGLGWREHVRIDENLFRPSDLESTVGDPSGARERLGWEARYDMLDVVRMMVEAEQEAKA
jgi:GDPmannose 4,6-dehydratase